MRISTLHRPLTRLLIALAFSLSSPLAAAPLAPVDASIYSTLQETSRVEVLVYFRQQADLSGAERIQKRLDKTRYVHEQLNRTAAVSQKAVQDELRRLNIPFKSFAIANALLVKADRELIEQLRSRPEVRKIGANPTFHMLQTPVAQQSAPNMTTGIEWNVQSINAPTLWAQGIKGQGVVIAGNDTGVDWTHPAITRQYRGNTSSGVSHDHNWFDAYGVSKVPYDDNSHGTFTVGQIVGDDGAGNQIGVAPEAQWIACKNMDGAGNGKPETYISCFNWFMAPTDSSGLNADPAYSPDVINNSWSCPSSEGCDRETLHNIVDAVQAAGILLIFSAGNSGPGCGTVNEPVAFYPEIFSVGAVDSSKAIASFSSRGPSTYDRSLKPNVAAPGVNIRSCVPGNTYGYMSGTSMAAPMVTGTVALLWSAVPDKKGDLNGVTTVIEQSATVRFSPRCGGDKATGANNTFGYGLLDANAAATAYAK